MLRKILLDYKLLHVIMWMLVTTSTFIVYHQPGDHIPTNVVNALLVTLFSTIPFYTTAYVLIPRYLYKSRFVVFIAALIALVIGSAMLTILAVRIGYHAFDETVAIIPALPQLKLLINLFTWNSLIAVFGAGGLKIMSDSFRLRKRLLEVEKEKLVTELNFLRSQINPHFLFNVINTIYFQIDMNNASARASVEKLSEMLRYQLYECTTDKIDVAKEVDYIKNYVGIQTLRMEKGTDVQLAIDSQVKGFTIAPLLILPIVENAFKHISNFKEAGQNKIHITINRGTGDQLMVHTVNTFDSTSGAKHVINSGGLGIENLKRRLQLLYPEKHTLEIQPNGHLFETTLKLQYHD